MSTAPLPGHPSRKLLQGQGRGRRAGGDYQRLPGANLRPLRQRAGIHRPGPTRLLRDHRHHQHCLHPNWPPLAERV
jgi:hypothetical protein